MSSLITINTSYKPRFGLYGQHAYYLFKSTIKELKMSLDKLAENFNREDVENSRLLLHQILGTGKILKDDVFSDQVQRAQIDVKANLFDEESIRELRKRLETVEKEVHKLCRTKERLINVVIYGKRQEQVAKLIEILEQWPQVNTVKATSNLDSLNGIIMKELPQLLLRLKPDRG